MNTKHCSRCDEIKEITKFSKDRAHSSGYKSACKACAAKDFKNWRTLNLEQARLRDKISQYRSSYKLSLEKAEELVRINREGICEICKQPTKLVVDHCHTSQEVRGFICSACNSVLGYSKDNTTTLRNAIVYLEKFYEL